jgi:small conductance mechanosensitive channel
MLIAAFLSAFVLLAQSGNEPQAPVLDGQVVVELEGCEDTETAVCDLVLELTGSQTAADVADLVVGKPIRILLILGIAWFLTRLVRRGGRRIADWAVRGATKKAEAEGKELSEDRRLRIEERAETIRRAARSIAVAVIWSVAGLLVLAELGVNLFPLLAAAGIAGLAIGLGAQSIVKDYLRGVSLLVENQLAIGDEVDLGEASGIVEDLNLSTTTVRDTDGNLWYVPNGQIDRVMNRSQLWSRALVDVRIAYDADIARVKAVVEKAADELGQEPQWSDLFLGASEAPYVQELAADAVVVRIALRVRRERIREVERELRERVKRALDDASISLQLPQQVVQVRSVSPSPEP